MVAAPMETTKMNREMHAAMRKLIDTVRPADLDAWLDEVLVADADGDMPWMIQSETHTATSIDGKLVILCKKRLH
jgi:hypothetical protein